MADPEQRVVAGRPVVAVPMDMIRDQMGVYACNHCTFVPLKHHDGNCPDSRGGPGPGGNSCRRPHVVFIEPADFVQWRMTGELPNYNRPALTTAASK